MVHLSVLSRLPIVALMSKMKSDFFEKKDKIFLTFINGPCNAIKSSFIKFIRLLLHVYILGVLWNFFGDTAKFKVYLAILVLYYFRGISQFPRKIQKSVLYHYAKAY